MTHVDCCRVLLEAMIERGMGLELSGSGGATPLLLAARTGSESAVEMLLDDGADMAAVDDRLDTALHGAASTANLGPCKLLLERVTYVFVCSDASRYSYSACLKPFLQMADVRAKNVEGDTPFHIAMKVEQAPTVVCSLVLALC